MSRTSGLRSLALQDRYRSDKGSLIEEFYIPAFGAATTYSRAVGYFTSTSLALYARGLDVFAAKGGHLRLIASPQLTEDDVEDIERGYEHRAVLERAVLRQLDGEDHSAILDGLGMLGRLIAKGQLDLKLAFTTSLGQLGIYHEKIGVFRDDSGDLVSFIGSSNETMGGLLANFESVEVYRGWEPSDVTRALRLEEDFNRLWENQTSGLEILEFPRVAREMLVKLGKERHRTLHPADDALTVREPLTSSPQLLSKPSILQVRGYQQTAIENWLRNHGRGILKMATGTGKTKTALLAATHLGRLHRDRNLPLVIVVTAPQQHLVDQWIDELEEFGVRPVAAYVDSKRWMPMLYEQMTEARAGLRELITVVATNATFCGERFQSFLTQVEDPFLLIADEAHHLGAARALSALPDNATYRLALSATPERWFDDEGTEALHDFFGGVVFELGLGMAIEMGALTPYHYYPRLVELDVEETELYAHLSSQIARFLAAGEDLETTDPDSPLGHLLRQRSGVLGHAAGKLNMLREDITPRSDEWFQLVYCAEGNRPTPAGEPDGPNQLRQVVAMLGRELGMAASSYTSRTLRRDRRVLLDRFGSGLDLRALVAMRCLDEGVDIPDARTGYLLASSSNPRQFIQRRGRLLRRAPGKDHAEIFDYLAVPNASHPVDHRLERGFLQKELRRANEFGKLSSNYEHTLRALRPVKERFQLLDL